VTDPISQLFKNVLYFYNVLVYFDLCKINFVFPDIFKWLNNNVIKFRFVKQ